MDSAVKTRVENGAEDEWEEDEELAVIELNGIIDQEAMRPTVCKILGADNERPVLQMDKYFFTGSYEDVVGTAAIFEEVKPTLDDSKHSLKYICKTSKKLTLQRSFLQPKETLSDVSVDDIQVNKSDTAEENAK